MKKIAYSDIQFHFKITYCTLYSNNLSLPCIHIAYLGPTLNCKSLQLCLGVVSLEAVSCVLCMSSPVSWTVFAPICLCAPQGCLYQILSSLLNCTEHFTSFLQLNIASLSLGHKHPLLHIRESYKDAKHLEGSLHFQSSIWSVFLRHKHPLLQLS